MNDLNSFISTLKPEFTESMRALLGDTEYGEYITALSSGKPMRALRVNTLKIDVDEFRRVSPFPLRATPFSPCGFVLEGDGAYGAHPYHHAGLYYMQEPSAMAAATAIAPYIGERVLDMCAAPGGKSTAVAAYMKGGVLVANEIVYSRAKILAENIERMGVRNAVITNNSPKELERLLPNYFDTVIVDAPCSGEGMFRKEEFAVRDWSAAHVEACAARQKEILRSAAKCLCGGGYMVYSTCTLNGKENEGVIRSFLDDNADFETMPIVGDLAATAAPSSVGGAIRLYPHRCEGEGHFVCLLRKNGARSVDDDLTFIDNYQPLRGLERDFYGMLSLFTAEKPARVGVYKDRIFLLPPEVPYVRGLNMLKAGVTACEIGNGRLTPHHSLAAALRKGEAVNAVSFTADSAEIAAYLRGETVKCAADLRGWGVICVDGYPLSVTKAVDGVLKNHYPKSLRNRK